MKKLVTSIIVESATFFHKFIEDYPLVSKITGMK